MVKTQIQCSLNKYKLEQFSPKNELDFLNGNLQLDYLTIWLCGADGAEKVRIVSELESVRIIWSLKIHYKWDKYCLSSNLNICHVPIEVSYAMNEDPARV